MGNPGDSFDSDVADSSHFKIAVLMSTERF